MEKTMKHYLVLIALLIAAFGFYLAGSATGAIALAAVGALLELSFWFGLIKGRNNKSQSV
jgi:hypothetical protein